MFTDEQVIYECDIETQCELKIVNTHPIGYLPIFSAKNWRICGYIQEYAGRNLTYQSDILRGINRVFRYLATNTIAQHQFWGLPVSLSALKEFEAIEVGQMPSSNKTPVIAISICLSWKGWSRSKSAQMSDGTRRHGFPSWSWCGWVLSADWTNGLKLYDKDYLADIPQDIHVRRADGSTLPLSDELAANLFRDDQLAKSFTYELYMRAEVLDIGIVYLDHAITFPWEPLEWSLNKTRYAAQVRRDSIVEEGDRKNGKARSYVWPIEPTPCMDETPELHTMLCSQVLQCILLAKPWALVVHTTSPGVCERIGLIHVLAQSDVNSMPQEFQGPHLRNHFPGSIRDIVLG